jgi:hypothetical protein
MPFVLVGKFVSGLKNSLPARKKTILAGASHQTPYIDSYISLPKEGYVTSFVLESMCFYMAASRQSMNKRYIVNLFSGRAGFTSPIGRQDITVLAGHPTDILLRFPKRDHNNNHTIGVASKL